MDPITLSKIDSAQKALEGRIAALETGAVATKESVEAVQSAVQSQISATHPNWESLGTCVSFFGGYGYLHSVDSSYELSSPISDTNISDCEAICKNEFSLPGPAKIYSIDFKLYDLARSIFSSIRSDKDTLCLVKIQNNSVPFITKPFMLRGHISSSDSGYDTPAHVRMTFGYGSIAYTQTDGYSTPEGEYTYHSTNRATGGIETVHGSQESITLLTEKDYSVIGFNGSTEEYTLSLEYPLCIESGETFTIDCGGIHVGPSDSTVVVGTIEYGIFKEN